MVCIFISKGVRDSLRLTRRELGINVNHILGVLKAKNISKDSNELKLHLGCGKRYLKGWLNIDIRKEADVFLDLRERWPFESSTVINVYAEHLLEHFEYPNEAKHFLQEAFRVLKPDGEIRLGVPDTYWPLISYSRGPDEDYFKMAKELWHPDYVNTPLEHINWHFRDFKGEHKYAYDETTLRNLLLNAGFVRIERGNFNPEIDSDKRKLGTLYMFALRPKNNDTLSIGSKYV